MDCSTNFEILRYAQDDRESVLDDSGQCVVSEEILRYAQDDRNSVLDDIGQCVVSEEILRYAQDDRESVQDDILHRLSLISTTTEFVVRVVQMWR